MPSRVTTLREYSLTFVAWLRAEKEQQRAGNAHERDREGQPGGDHSAEDQHQHHEQATRATLSPIARSRTDCSPNARSAIFVPPTVTFGASISAGAP